MRSMVLTVLSIFVSATLVFLLFNKIDFSIETNSLKEQIKLQRNEMRFLQNVTNGALSSSKMTVANFESVVHENKRDVQWHGDDALVGPFRVKKAGDCILSVEVVDGL